LRLCDEDIESFGGPEWVVFDDADLDDQIHLVLMRFEAELDIPLGFLMRIDRPMGTMRWIAAAVWMARKMADIDTPRFRDFTIKPKKVIAEDVVPEVAAEGADVDPPSSPDSTETGESNEALS
jgi:hypothetical protein